MIRSTSSEGAGAACGVGLRFGARDGLHLRSLPRHRKRLTRPRAFGQHGRQMAIEGARAAVPEASTAPRPALLSDSYRRYALGAPAGRVRAQLRGPADPLDPAPRTSARRSSSPTRRSASWPGIAFALFYTFAGIPIARWADTGSRRTIISLAVFVWSGMTALTGLATSFATARRGARRRGRRRGRLQPARALADRRHVPARAARDRARDLLARHSDRRRASARCSAAGSARTTAGASRSWRWGCRASCSR